MFRHSIVLPQNAHKTPTKCPHFSFETKSICLAKIKTINLSNKIDLWRHTYTKYLAFCVSHIAFTLSNKQTTMSSFKIVKPLDDKYATKYHIEGWNGPFKGKFCHKYALGSKRGVGLFATFRQALDAAEECDECQGITYQPGKGYSLRKSGEVMTQAWEADGKDWMSWTKQTGAFDVSDEEEDSDLESDDEE